MNSSFSLSFTPLVSPALLIALGVAALLIIALALWARRPGAWLRALGFALLLLALADPALVREEREPLKDVVALVVDRSASQTLAERRAQTDAARAAVESRLADVPNIDLRVIESAASDNGIDGTRLFSALNNGLADVPPGRLGGIIMLTDGVVHDIPASLEQSGLSAPLHVLITGKPKERDRRIELIEAPRFGIVGRELNVTVKVHDNVGTLASDAPLGLRVRRDGADVASLNAQPGQSVTIPVKIEHGGPNVLEFEVDGAPGELTLLNNRAVLTVDGVRDKLKVLLVSGEPHAGERTWRNLLRSDANVDLVHFTILRPPEKQDGTPINELSLIAFPTSDLFGKKIVDFDLIIFDRYSNQSVLPAIYLDNIARYVRDGGALLIAVGPDFAKPSGIYHSPLGKIAPARPDGVLMESAFRARVSPDGLKHPVTRDLPGSASEPPQWSEWFRQVSAEVSRGHAVLTGAQDKPLLVLSREGKGRVAELLSDQMWLWARGYEGGGPHLDLLRRTAHWLMKEPELEEEALRAKVRGQELAIERQTLKDASGMVTVTAPSGARTELSLAPAVAGLSRARFSANEYGLHKISDGDLSVLANVGPDNPREFQDVISNPELLRPLAEASGGSVRRLDDGSGSLSVPRIVSMREATNYAGGDWIGVRRTGASSVKGIGIAPLALGLIGMLALLCAFVAAWFVEGRKRV